MTNILEFIKNNDIDDMIINILLNAGLIIIFIAIFFFTYVSVLEKDIIKKQANIITSDLVSSIKPFLTNTDIINLKANLKTPDMTEQDNQSIIDNQNVKNTAYTYVIIIYAIIITTALLLSIYFIDPERNNYITNVQLNLIILIIVGLTEFIYAISLPSNYIIGDPNYVKHKIITSIHNKFKFSPS